MDDNRPSYKENTYWKNYQTYLPPSLTLPNDDLPAEEWWNWQDGEIHLDRYAVENAPATVIVLHGAGSYGRLLAPYARLLKQAGFETVAPDLPGYGLSRVPRHLVNHDRWVDCVSELVQAERAHRDRPIVLLGGSLGGYLGYLAAAKTPDVAGVIATTLADPRLPLVRAQFARHPWLGKFGPFLMPYLDRLCGQVRLPIKWFSNMKAIANDAPLVKVFLADRLGAGNYVTIHFMRSLFEAQPLIEPENFDRCPVLLVHPAADRWTTVEASRLFFDRIKAKKQLALLENCGHFPIEEPGVTQLRNTVVDFLREVSR